MTGSHVAVNIAQPTPWRTPVARGALRAHAPALAPILLVALWVMRHDLLSTALPAGTDMLGFITRAHQNASWDWLLSPWDPGTLGALRPVTMDNVLGLMTIVTGDAIVTVKLVALLTLSLSGGLAYLLAWHWFGRRSTALIAGLLYMTSQASISHWAGGQLNVEVAIALAPLVVDLWFRCLEQVTVARALRLALAVSAMMFVRFDMVLYVVPFCLGHLIVSACFRGLVDTLRVVARTALIALPALVAINLVQLLPLIAGLRPAWLTTGRIFDTDELLTRSLDAYPSLLGFGREIGYLGFSGQQTWYSHPWLPLAAYEAAACVVVVLALAAVWWRRDERVLSLVAAALIATFIAKGTRDPLGAPYRWAVDHVALAGNLRDPNRWLIVQAIAYSALAAVTLTYLADRVRSRWWQRGPLWRGAVVGAAVAVAATLFAPVGPTLVTGLRTWRPQSAQLALLEPIRAAPGDFAVASVPYDQTMRFLEQGSYRGFEHDLGAESATFTNHAALADGGWLQGTADVVAYSSTLLSRRDAAFTELLASLGVRYLVAFRYPATAPHLCPPQGSARRCTLQQRAAGRMPGLVPVARNRAGTLYRVRGAAPRISFRPHVAALLGGRSGLAALAHAPGVDLAEWAPLTADDVIATRGLGALLLLIRSADRVLFSNATVQDLAVLAAPGIGTLPGITRDPALDRRTQLVGSDASTRTGSLADQTLPRPRRASRAAGSFRVTSTQDVEVWTRLAVGPTAGELRFSLDGRQIARITPLALKDETFAWMRLLEGRLSAGEHRLEVRGGPSAFGTDYEVDETKVIAASARGDAQLRLTNALRSAAGRVSYGLDMRYLQGSGLPARVRRPVDAIVPRSRPFWRAGEPGRTHPAGRGWRYDGRRTAYTILLHRFAKPQDWSLRRYVFLRYRGTGSGNTYRFSADFDRRRQMSLSTAFVDDAPGWRTAALRLPINRDGRRQAASRVFSLRIGTERKDASGSFEPGVPMLGAQLGRMAFSYPLLGPARRVRAVTIEPWAAHQRSGRTMRIAVRSGAMQLRLPPGVAASATRLLIDWRGAAQERRPVPVHVGSEHPTAYGFSLRTREHGVLAFAHGYQERWQLSTAGRTTRPLRLGTATNGYPVRPGDYRAQLRLRGRALPVIGLALSLLALLVVAPVALADRGAASVGERERRWWPAGDGARLRRVASRRESALAAVIVLWAPLAFAASLVAGVLLVAGVVLAPRLRWWVPWACAMSLLATTVVLAATGAEATLNRVAVGFLVCMTAALCRLLADAARSRRADAAPD